VKKLFTLLLMGILALSLTACGGEKDDSKDKEKTKSNVTEEKENTEASEEEYEEDEDESFEEDEDFDEDVVEKINMVYGDDKIAVTLHKPENAEFTLGSDNPEDAGDLVGICADDYSWDAEIMGYRYYDTIGSNVPFVDYYFAGNVNVYEEIYESYSEDAVDLGIQFDGKPVKRIRYTYKTVYDEDEYTECFVGFEYSGAYDKGLMGIKIPEYGIELSDSELEKLFCELFGI